MLLCTCMEFFEASKLKKHNIMIFKQLIITCLKKFAITVLVVYYSFYD